MDDFEPLAEMVLVSLTSSSMCDDAHDGRSKVGSRQWSEPAKAVWMVGCNSHDVIRNGIGQRHLEAS
jgi:hypothetical protein